MARWNKSRLGLDRPQTEHRRMTRMRFPGLDENPETMSGDGEDDEFDDGHGFTGAGNPHMKFGWRFLDAAKNGDARTMKELLDPNLPVNVIDPDDRATALHYIATFGARPALRVIVKSRNLDYLLRDGEGRLPSELAREFGHDDAMARLLLIKETRQARAQGRDPGSLYKVSARKPAL